MHVVCPTLDAPVLAFDGTDREATAIILQARIDDLHARYRRAFNASEKCTLAIRIRKTHLVRVSLAIGVRMPGRHVVHEFMA